MKVIESFIKVWRINMTGNIQFRTDLALEARECIQKKDAEHIKGILLEEYDVTEEIHISKVEIRTKNAAKNMGKPMGNYITIEAKSLQDADEDYHREVSEELAKIIRKILPGVKDEKSILVVGLGNRDVTADALGPCTVDNLFITRHIINEYGKQAYKVNKMHKISSLVPGVMAKTGMETIEIVKGVIKESQPDIVIVIDALAARSVKRLNRTIQVTDTGIHPGSGVGNHRKGLTQDNLGVPVIAIGIPMVVDAGTIVIDAIENISGEYIEFLRNNLDNHLNNMYVTTKNIDETTKRLSFTLAEAINIALDMSKEELT